jgi:arsenate reductase
VAPTGKKKGPIVTLPTADSPALLLHNPKCSKSRATRALLEEHGVEFDTRLYLEEPLDEAELRDLGRRLGQPPVRFTRTKQSEFAEAGLDPTSGAEEILAAMARQPILMERPILILGPRAAIGRPPEDVLALFG